MADFFGSFQGTYDASKVIVTIDDVIIHGFSDGDFIVAKYDDDRYAKIKGIDGEVGRIRSVLSTGIAEVACGHRAREIAADGAPVRGSFDAIGGKPGAWRPARPVRQHRHPATVFGVRVLAATGERAGRGC